MFCFAGNPEGRITSFKQDMPGQHTISFNCKSHKDCKLLKLHKKLPADYQASKYRSKRLMGEGICI